jgi:GNAT superfamily N-acetyltransferase
MRIRTANSTDLDLVTDLRLAFLCEVRELNPSEIADRFRAATRTFFDETRRSGRLWTWIAEEQGQVLGLVSLVVGDVPPLLEDAKCKEGFIINEYVIPSARSSGVGRLLLRSALDGGSEMGIRQFTLYSTDAGSPMYLSEGFAVHDRFMVRTVPADAP